MTPKRARDKYSATTNSVSRREFVRNSLSYYAALLSLPVISSCGSSGNNYRMVSNLSSLGPLLGPDDNNCLLPEGFTSKIIAQSSLPVISGSSFNWHSAPDGGACYKNGAGWIYVSNSEVSASGQGGASAIVFDQNGEIEDAYSILTGTTRNCAGGTTPYGTWLSCEENGDIGKVYECDPTGVESAIERPALGSFNHEAVAYDLINHTLYLTEDRSDGGLYRFIPNAISANGYADLSSGQLEIAEVILGTNVNRIVWHEIPDPLALTLPTRYQIASYTPFKGGEGIIYHNDSIAFTTKGDNRVWRYNIPDHTIEILYDDDTSDNPILTGVDNITVNFAGDYLVAEDGGDQQIVVIDQNKQVSPLLGLSGHNLSEITGPAFSPDGSRLYFSSQRGLTGHSADGITFEISGPFFSKVKI